MVSMSEPPAPATIPFAGAVRRCLANYVTVAGRASRSEFWWFLLFVLLVEVGMFLWWVTANVDPVAGAVHTVVLLALVPPLLAVASRRLHDTGKPAWWLLLAVVPFGVLVLLAMMALEPTPGPNRFGPAPL